MGLTDDWKAGKLEKCKRYWVKSPLSLETKPAFLYNDNSFDVDGTIYPNNYDLEVLASCDYDHFVELTEKVKSQDEELQQLKEEKDKWAYQCGKSDAEKWESQRGNTHLRTLLKECKEQLEYHSELIFCELEGCDKGKIKFKNLLTRINAAIGESEGK